MNQHIHVLHLNHRQDRMDNLMKQFKEQNIIDYTIVEGFRDLAAVFRGISISHNSIVALAAQQGLESVTIAEDDICFTAPGAWQYYLENIPKSYDIFLGGIYEGKINEENRIMPDPFSFSGLTLYTVHSRFYNEFLNMNIMAHKDKQLGSFAGKFKYIVCNPFVAIQMDGYSDQKKQYCKYEHLLKGRKLFGV